MSQTLSHTAIWSTSYSTITFGSEPQLEIILNCETSDTSIIFSVNSKNSVCEFYEKSIGEPDRYDFSISCPAHYFDTEFLRTATTEHKYWKEKESSHYDRFLYPPTGLLISRVASENFSTPTDPSYSHERRMAKRGAGARYPILEY